jgi:hypothetical protein
MIEKSSKRFAIPADRIRQLIPSLGGCLATDQIVVESKPVGVMYREPPDNDVDSGWRFLSGEESEAELDDPSASGIYEVNTIANHDREIIRFLSYPEGTRVERHDGKLVVVEGPDDPPDVVLLPAVDAGPFRVGRDFQLTLATLFLRRVQGEDLILWKPGLTAYFALYGADDKQPPEERLNSYLRDASPDRFDERRDARAGLFTASYRLDETSDEGTQSGLYAAATTTTAYLQCAFYFDDDATGEEAEQIWRSLASA